MYWLPKPSLLPLLFLLRIFSATQGRAWLVFFCCWPHFCLYGQEVFRLTNPSFEWDSPGAGRVPYGWANLGVPDESPVDIQPGYFGNDTKAKDGRCYVGMVTRDNGSWEGIAQTLEGWLRKDSAYTFSVWLAVGPRYVSISRATGREINFDGPVVLNIVGYNTRTGAEQLLGQTTPVQHTAWKKFEFMLYPTTADFDEIDLIVYYGDEARKTSGHLLVDHCSDIRRVPNVTFPKYGSNPPPVSATVE
jgi:hypothetical protein